MEFTKPTLTYNEQITLLKNRGLIFGNEISAKEKLSSISYFRLSAYMLPFRKKEGDILTNEFKNSTKWEDIYNLYVFDRKLRLLIFDAIERIEVAIRSKIVYHLGLKYGSHWQDNPSIFKPAIQRTLKNGQINTFVTFNEIQEHIKNKLNDNQAELYIKSYKANYTSPSNPPSWMCVEVMYFNHLSKICNSLKYRADITAISKEFDLPPSTFKSWLHTINYVRNQCAHHSRLWNRDFHIIPEKLSFSRNRTWISNSNNVQRSKLYYFLCMLNYLLQSINPTSSFKQKLHLLLKQYPYASKSSMGFPLNWENEEIWKNK